MNERFQLVRQAAQEWAEAARAAGWLTSRDLAALAQVEHRSPAALFDADERRPLVVAFFGGTGVGKSTLLNRLAGENIAATGVVRPTSREICVYLHDSVRLQHLPDGFPMDRVRKVVHQHEADRHILWIDMPDFDSTEAFNHRLALDWLPYVDVLIYVVSPERYRDDRGWRLLLSHEQDHAWVFVMNHWDRGHRLQVEDFRRLLASGGFDDPLVFCTDSRPDSRPHQADEFPDLQATLRDLGDHRAVEQLSRHADEARWHALRAAISALLQKFGDSGRTGDLQHHWSALWREHAATLRQGLDWPIRELALRFVRREADPLRKSLDLTKTSGPGSEDAPLITLLWDEWTQLRFEDTLAQLLVEADQRALPVTPLKNALLPLRHKASRIVLDQAQLALRQALARPGRMWQRLVLKMTGLVAVLLPLAALSWVAYQVVIGYYESAQSHLGFLGTDFAIHSALLITVSWLLPYFLHRKLRPSAESSAQQGLRAGVELGLDVLSTAVSEQLAEFQREHGRWLEEGARLARQCQLLTAPAPLEQAAHVGQMLSKPKTA